MLIFRFTHLGSTREYDDFNNIALIKVVNPFTEVKKIGKILPIGSNSLHRKHFLEIFIKKRMRISNSTFLILEVQTYRNTHIENHETFECRLKFVK